jgi:hypothetical protein
LNLRYEYVFIMLQNGRCGYEEGFQTMGTTTISVSTVVAGKNAETMPGGSTQHDELGNTDEEATVPAEQERRTGERRELRHW